MDQDEKKAGGPLDRAMLANPRRDATALTVETVSLSTDAEPVSIDLRYNAEENRLRVLPLSPRPPG